MMQSGELFLQLLLGVQALSDYHPHCVLSFAEVMNRRMDEPLPLKPSDLYDTTFHGFSLKRIKNTKKEVEKCQTDFVVVPSTIMSLLCCFPVPDKAKRCRKAG